MTEHQREWSSSQMLQHATWIGASCIHREHLAENETCASVYGELCGYCRASSMLRQAAETARLMQEGAEEPANDLSLTTFDKQEWWDVYREFKPDATELDFEAAWERFQVAKKQRGLS
jgi:hypothetical protein